MSKSLFDESLYSRDPIKGSSNTYVTKGDNPLVVKRLLHDSDYAFKRNLEVIASFNNLYSGAYDVHTLGIKEVHISNSERQICFILRNHESQDLRSLIRNTDKFKSLTPQQKIDIAGRIINSVAWIYQNIHLNVLKNKSLRSVLLYEWLEPKRVLLSEDCTHVVLSGFFLYDKIEHYSGNAIAEPIIVTPESVTVSGSFALFSPEQLQEEMTLDGRKMSVDELRKTMESKTVHLFGTLLYQLLTGKTDIFPVPDADYRAYKHHSELYTLIQLRKGLTPDLSDYLWCDCPLTKELASIIRDCWKLDPRERPSFLDLCTRSCFGSKIRIY